MSNKKEQQLKEEIEKAKRKLPTFSGNYTQAECFANILEAGLILEYIEWQIKEAELKGYQQAQKEDLESIENRISYLKGELDKIDNSNVKNQYYGRINELKILREKIKGGK